MILFRCPDGLSFHVLSDRQSFQTSSGVADHKSLIVLFISAPSLLGSLIYRGNDTDIYRYTGNQVQPPRNMALEIY